MAKTSIPHLEAGANDGCYRSFDRLMKKTQPEPLDLEALAEQSLVESSLGNERILDHHRAKLAIEQARDELGDQKGGIRRKIANQAALDWAAVMLAMKTFYNSGGDEPIQVLIQEKRLQNAHSRYMRSLAALTRVRSNDNLRRDEYVAPQLPKSPFPFSLLGGGLTYRPADEGGDPM